MIRHPDQSGVAFSQASDGDQRNLESRQRFSAQAGAPPSWALVRQVHGNVVHRAISEGVVGEGDAVWTSVPDLAVAILTADCFAVAMGSDNGVGVAHSGWRGAKAGVVTALRSAMTAGGAEPTWAAVGPGIRDCCFEVGPEVAAEFAGFTALTSWGTASVDLCGVIDRQLRGLQTWSLESCTFSDPGWFSHRKDASRMRLATIGWLT